MTPEAMRRLAQEIHTKAEGMPLSRADLWEVGAEIAEAINNLARRVGQAEGQFADVVNGVSDAVDGRPGACEEVAEVVTGEDTRVSVRLLSAKAGTIYPPGDVAREDSSDLHQGGIGVTWRETDKPTGVSTIRGDGRCVVVYGRGSNILQRVHEVVRLLNRESPALEETAEPAEPAEPAKPTKGVNSLGSFARKLAVKIQDEYDYQLPSVPSEEMPDLADWVEQQIAAAITNAADLVRD